MKAKDIMTRDVMTMDKDERLGVALQEMRKRGVSKLPVTEKGNLVGVVTDGDMVDELGSIRSRGVNPDTLHLTAALRKDVPTVAPEADLADVARLLLTDGLGIVPVVEDAKVVGIITKADLLPFVKSDQRIDAFMVKELHAVAPQDRVIHARRVMLDRGVERLPVIDGGRLVGIVGEMDMAEGLAKVKQHFSVQHQDNRLRQFYVEDIMVRDVVTGEPGMTARDAAARMREEDVGSLPVVNGNDRIAGMITRTDLLRFADF